MSAIEGGTTDDLWTPYKELLSVVEGYLIKEGKNAPYAVHTFESVLRRHKQTFLTLMKNPPKNPTNREEIKRGITDGLNLPSIGRTILSKELVDEAIIISDMYNVNEYLALELLVSASRQGPRQPGVPRGIVAVLLYYDGRRAIARALRHLMDATHGISWSIEARPEVVAYVSRYVEQLIGDGLLQNALEALKSFSLANELQLLQNNRALPPRKHHTHLVSSIENTRKMLAGVIFSASAQRGLERDFLMRLLRELSKETPQGPTGALDDVSLTLHMALLYAIDLSVISRREDGEEIARRLPLIRDACLLPQLVQTLLSNVSGGACAVARLALALALAQLKRAPPSLNEAMDRAELLDQDEALVDAAIDAKVFEYLDEAILSNEMIYKEEFFQRRVHTLITDFIVLMHSKLMEMRVKADESFRAAQMYCSEGLAPPTTSAKTFDALLRCMNKLYIKDPLNLRMDYWPGEHQTHNRSGWAVLWRVCRSVVCEVGSRGAVASLCVRGLTWQALTQPPHAADRIMNALQQYKESLSSDGVLSNPSYAASMGASGLAPFRQGKMIVRQEEVEALISALGLIEAVARVDPAASVAICENLQWDAVNTMFGLMCCGVPLRLKSALCNTLSALAVGGSSRVWAALEAAQLVNQTKDRGINAELQEMECRMEEFPLSRSFLSLLISLSSSNPLPLALGAGHRTPGLQPYLSHVRDNLFLPALHRSYLHRHEKWQVLSQCLELFLCWLSSYNPNENDPQPPGFHLMLQLHNDSDTLRVMLHILHQTQDLIYDVHGQEFVYVEKCLTSTLRLLEVGLRLEREFQQVTSEGSRTIPIVGLSKLLLAESVGDGVSCGVSLVVGVVGVVGVASAAATDAAKVLLLALRHRDAKLHLLTNSAHQPNALYVRHGFVECLDSEDWMEGENAQTVKECKQTILEILLQLLPTSPPNFAHFLLGYALTEHISRSQLNEPGAGGFPRTCLHSVLDILEQHITMHDESEPTELIESCYKLLYWLCARPNTSGPLLRLLQSRDHLLTRHLQVHTNLENASALSISCRAWVVRACACACASLSRSSMQRMVHALIGLTTDSDKHTLDWQQCVLRRLMSAPVSVRPTVEPRWELFHADQLRKAIADCDVNTGSGGKRISVSRLHALLAREMSTLQATAPQKNLLTMEIQKVLDYVTELNKQRNLAAILTHYYDSWRQLTEILFCVVPQDLLPIETRKSLILNILQDLLNKIDPAEVLPQIGTLGSGTVMLLMVNLRHCYTLQRQESAVRHRDEQSDVQSKSQVTQAKSLTLRLVVHKIVSWLVCVGGSTQKMRVNLYAALLNQLRLESAEAERDGIDQWESRLDKREAVVGWALETHLSRLMALVVGDCVGGHHPVCRLLALGCLDALLLLPACASIDHLTKQGYLRTLLDSLAQDDAGLKQALEPNPKSLRVLYEYESKMALLTKIASTRTGAETVLSQGALATLANLKVLDCHPDIHTGYGTKPDTEFLPSVANRFRQILIPALSLCDALLTTLGTQNHSCIIHVTHFLVSHVECLDVILRSAHPCSPVGLLIELSSLTGVIARSSDREAFGFVREDSSLQNKHPQMMRIKALLLQLLMRFAQHNTQDLASESDDQLLYYKIIANLLTYARNITAGDWSRAITSSNEESVSCPAVVRLMQNSVKAVHAHDKLLATTQHHLANVHTMTIEDMKKLLPSESSDQSPWGIRVASANAWRAKANRARKAHAFAKYALEVALALLRDHVDVYLRMGLRERYVNESLTPVTALSAAYKDQLIDLQKNIIGVFNDRFTEELLETAKNQPATQRAFLEVLVKDIKSMIQFAPI